MIVISQVWLPQSDFSLWCVQWVFPLHNKNACVVVVMFITKCCKNFRIYIACALVVGGWIVSMVLSIGIRVGTLMFWLASWVCFLTSTIMKDTSSSSAPLIFDVSDYEHWKVRMKAHLKDLNDNVWIMCEKFWARPEVIMKIRTRTMWLTTTRTIGVLVPF